MPNLNIPQARFIALPQKFKAFVAGYGSGKTWVGGADLCKHAWEWPKVNSGYFAPTYAQIRDIFYPTIDQVAHDWGLSTKIHETNKEVHLFEGRVCRGTILCRSMEKANEIVGFKIGRALIDEMDVLKKLKAQTAWRKIIARMRYKVDGLPNGVSITTTPEGFKFVWEMFVKALREKPELAKLYGLVHASTFDNEANLPPDYISSLMASYPPQLILAFLKGQFVNLASGSVYPDFDRTLSHTDAVLEDGEQLHVGLDFNVYNCTAIICIVRKGVPLAVGELKKMRDTPHVIQTIKEKFPGRSIAVYPDASGQSNKTVNATESDVTLLRQAGFEIRVNPSNPFVKERVMSVNALILNAAGTRTLKVNTNLCPVLTECLEQQVYDENKEPDKKSDTDHPPDALGYFIHYHWAIAKPSAQITKFRI